MFNNPGKALMWFARSIFLALVVFCIGFGVLLMIEHDMFVGIFFILVGILSSFLLCLILSAIGHAVESLRIIAVSTNVIANEPFVIDESNE